MRQRLQTVNDIPLRLRLTLLFVLVAVLPLAVVVQVFYNHAMQVVYDKFAETNKVSLELIGERLNVVSDRIEEATVRLYSDSGVQRILKPSDDGGVDLAAYNRAAALVNNIQTEDYVHAVQLFDADLQLYAGISTRDTFRYDAAQPFNGFDRVIRLQGKLDWVGVIPSNNEYHLLVSRAINDLMTFEFRGLLVLSYREAGIRALYEPLRRNPAENIYIVDSEGKIISSNRQEAIGAAWAEQSDLPLERKPGFYSGQTNQHYYFYTTNERNLWQIVSIAPFHILEKEIGRIQYWMASLFALSIAVITIVSLFVSKWVTRPILVLTRLIQKVQQGDWTLRSDITQRDEIGSLARGYNVMVGRLNDQLKEIYAEQQKQKEMELKAMQMQMNPHFLYNSLEIIRGMAQRKHVPEIESMILHLSGFYRIALSQGKETVSLREELELTEKYLSIQRLLLQPRLVFYIEADDTLYSYEIVKLVLQPLVENAIVHGFHRDGRKACIEIIVSRQGDRIHFHISDNGVGIAPRKLDEINAMLTRNSRSEYEGYGIYNVHHRIALYYGSGYGLRYDSEADKGTTVHFSIPVTPPGRFEK